MYICLFLQQKYSRNFIVWTMTISACLFLYKIFMRIFQVNIFSWYFAFFSGSFFYGLKDLFTLLHISWQSCPWTLKLMTSQAVELMWIRMGGSGAYGHGVARFGSIVLWSKLDFLRKRGTLHCSAVHSWELCQKSPFTASQAVLWSLSGCNEPKLPRWLRGK